MTAPPAATRQVAAGSSHEAVSEWARLHGSYAGRWKLRAGRPEYESAGSTVHEGEELATGRPVAVKIVRDISSLQAELAGRGTFGASFVVPVLEHAAVDAQGRLAREASHGIKSEPSREGGEWAIAMPLGDRNGQDIIGKERSAGRDVEFVVLVATDLAACLAHLHEHGRVHRDVKPRNVVRVVLKHMLIDLVCLVLLPYTQFQPPQCAEAAQTSLSRFARRRTRPPPSAS